MNLDEIVPKEKIEEIFARNSIAFVERKFNDQQKLIALGLLKVASGYRSGMSLTNALDELALIIITDTFEQKLTKKGKEYLYWYYQNKT